MVLKKNFSFLQKKNWFLNYFFLLWWKKRWSGGRSFGKKVFRGQVGKVSGRWFLYNIIRDYSIMNISGTIQAFVKPLYVNSIFSLLFFPKYGLFSIIPTEETTWLSSTYINDIFNKEINLGNSTILENFSIGEIIFSLQTKRYNLACVGRSSGMFCKILKKTHIRAFIQYPSKLVSIIPLKMFATRGVSKKINFEKLKKAGQSYLYGWIPKVRGIAMNPVDHPHGGRTNGGCHPRTPTGFLTKNVKTWKKKWWSDSIIFSLWK